MYTIGIEVKEKKQPNDYPVLSFRIDQEAKDSIVSEIEKIVVLLNKEKSESEYLIRKNNIYREAMLLGVSKLKKKHRL